MTKRTAEAVEASSEPVPVVGTTKVLLGSTPVNPALVANVAAPVSGSEGLITFDMYMTVRNVPAQRRAGMRAFTTVQSTTMSDWNRIFRSY